MADQQSADVPPRTLGLSLYANLLDPDAAKTSASVSRTPVVFKTGKQEVLDEASKKSQIDAATLRFQPTRRPQLQQKPKSKPAFQKAPITEPTTPGDPPASVSSQTLAKPIAKNTLADWTAVGDDDDVNGFYGGEKRQRGGRKRRKKNKEERYIAQDWDDIYDPSRPNNYEEYKQSDEKIREVREWKDRLYSHRIVKSADSDKWSGEEEDFRPKFNSQFAPPTSYSFAPPPMGDPPLRPETATSNTIDEAPYSPKLDQSSPPPPPPDSISSFQPAPPPPPMGTIFRAPVRYNLPLAPTELPRSEAELEKALAAEMDEDEEESDNGDVDVASETLKSNRPGQRGFAERLLTKYGWTKGTGLGADGSGIINPLRVQVEKRKKKSAAEGGGFRDSGGRGKIIGGERKIPEAEPKVGIFGPMSNVIVLRGMVDGMDLDEEVEGSEGGIMQEIGDECAEKYGRVERVYIDRQNSSARVFVKFTSQLSALRAVNALEGRVFNGNTISALFYDTDAFEQGNYKHTTS